jgi:hypothetical protein
MTLNVADVPSETRRAVTVVPADDRQVHLGKRRG